MWYRSKYSAWSYYHYRKSSAKKKSQFFKHSWMLNSFAVSFHFGRGFCPKPLTSRVSMWLGLACRMLASVTREAWETIFTSLRLLLELMLQWESAQACLLTGNEEKMEENWVILGLAFLDSLPPFKLPSDHTCVRAQLGTISPTQSSRSTQLTHRLVRNKKWLLI